LPSLIIEWLKIFEVCSESRARISRKTEHEGFNLQLKYTEVIKLRHKIIMKLKIIMEKCFQEYLA